MNPVDHFQDLAPTRFWPYVDKSGDCWLWTGSFRRYGAGIVTYMDNGRQRTASAHKVSWTIHFGPVLPGKRVIQTCGVAACVRPDHLKLSSSRLTTIQRRFAHRELPEAFLGCSERDYLIFVQHVREHRSYDELAADHQVQMKTVRKIVDDVARLLAQADGSVRPKQGDRRVRPEIVERPAGVNDRNWSVYQRYMQGQESLAEIGSDLSLSRERIRQIVKAVEKRAN